MQCEKWVCMPTIMKIHYFQRYHEKENVVTATPPSPMDGEEFYAVITQKEVSESGLWE